MTIFDVLVIGTGPAGLSAALSLARQSHSAVLFDSGTYRDALTQHVYTMPSWDHKDPRQLRATARAELQHRYKTLSFVHTRLVRIEPLAPAAGEHMLFAAHADDGSSWSGRRVLLATGVHDVLPDIPGFADCWAARIYPCLSYHGVDGGRAASAGVLATDGTALARTAVAMSRGALRIAARVNIYTNGAERLAADVRRLLAESGQSAIRVDARSIGTMTLGPHAASVALTLADGSAVVEDFVLHKPKTELRGSFARDLGLDVTEDGDIDAGRPHHQTSRRGVYAAGDCMSATKSILVAMSTGAVASEGIMRDLQRVAFESHST